jgi:hypothetical protein
MKISRKRIWRRQGSIGGMGTVVYSGMRGKKNYLSSIKNLIPSSV